MKAAQIKQKRRHKTVVAENGTKESPGRWVSEKGIAQDRA
jgi:hypothetical protein